jgi:hypothetical protein
LHQVVRIGSGWCETSRETRERRGVLMDQLFERLDLHRPECADSPPAVSSFTPPLV